MVYIPSILIPLDMVIRIEGIYSNISGDGNTANGVYSLYSNTTGYGNSGLGN